MTKNHSFPAACTAVGSLVGGIIWLIGYSATYRPETEIGFDGPASMALGFSMIISGLLFGIIALSIYAHKNPKRRLLDTLVVCVLSGAFVSISFGFIISKYEIQHTGHCMEASQNSNCLDEVGSGS